MRAVEVPEKLRYHNRLPLTLRLRKLRLEVVVKENSDRTPISPNEETATETKTQWPPEDYRAWVNTEVGSRVFFRFAAVGVAAVIAVGTAFWAIQSRSLEDAKGAIGVEVRDNLQNQLTNQVEDINQDLKETVTLEVLRNIIDHADIIKTAQKEIRVEINKIVESEEFTNQATEILYKMLRETEAAQEIILMEALSRAKNRDLPESTRALGLQLYALLHGGDHSSEDVPPMREMFLTILEDENREANFRSKLLAVILQHYPLGKYESNECAIESPPIVDPCLAWDTRILQEVLSLLNDDRKYTLLEETFNDFVSRVPSALTGDVFAWARNNENMHTSRNILKAAMRSGDADVLAEMVSKTALLTVERTRPELRIAGFEVLGSLDPYAPIDRKVRSKALAEGRRKNKCRFWCDQERGQIV